MFDCCIMNPPYDKSLHLKIIAEILPHCNKVVNISPCRWLEDPLARYATDIIDKRTAQEIWDNDKQKTDYCKELGITLIRIKEQDYLRNKDNILYFIMLLLEL